MFETVELILSTPGHIKPDIIIPILEMEAEIPN